MNDTTFKEVTKLQFKEAYFRLGRGASGWTAEYWQKCLENAPKEPDWKFLVKEPSSIEDKCMSIVIDIPTKQYRLFCMSEDGVEALYDYPGKD